MTQASIGHHCPECLAGNNQQVYTARDIRSSSRSNLIVALVAVNVAVFLAQEGSNDRITVDGLLWGPAVADGEWWRIITSAFLHGSLLHIGFNMFLLWQLGKPLLDGFGWARFGLIYLTGLFGGSAAVLAFNWGAPTLGASGAVLGLAGALVAILWARGIGLNQTSLTPLIGLNLFLPLLVGGISFWGHFGGIAAGFAAGWLLSWLPIRMRASASQATMAAGALCAALAVVALVVGTSGGLASL
jgi:membrane associated rhomboid family serine protease